jgi:hypothetical protein
MRRLNHIYFLPIADGPPFVHPTPRRQLVASPTRFRRRDFREGMKISVASFGPPVVRPQGSARPDDFSAVSSRPAPPRSRAYAVVFRLAAGAPTGSARRTGNPAVFEKRVDKS